MTYNEVKRVMSEWADKKLTDKEVFWYASFYIASTTDLDRKDLAHMYLEGVKPMDKNEVELIFEDVEEEELNDVLLSEF